MVCGDFTNEFPLPFRPELIFIVACWIVIIDSEISRNKSSSLGVFSSKKKCKMQTTL